MSQALRWPCWHDPFSMGTIAGTANTTMRDTSQSRILPDDLFLDADQSREARPIWLVREDQTLDSIEGLTAIQRSWLRSMGFKGTPKKHLAVPGADGEIAGVMLGIGNGEKGEPCGPSILLAGQLASRSEERRVGKEGRSGWGAVQSA